MAQALNQRLNSWRMIVNNDKWLEGLIKEVELSNIRKSSNDDIEYAVEVIDKLIDKLRGRADTEKRIQCHWCLCHPIHWIDIEGFNFCDSTCEGKYYDDRDHRRNNGLPNLSLERANKSPVDNKANRA
jgi:hypothetical protein